LTIPDATIPSNNFFRPERPFVPTTTKSIFYFQQIPQYRLLQKEM
jgi:hypothetical protein